MATVNKGSIATSFTDMPNFSELAEARIATEANRCAEAGWQNAIDSLLTLWKETGSDQKDESAPTQVSIERAITYLFRLRGLAPDSPPTLVVREPAGGIIIERCDEDPSYGQVIDEYTFYNDGKVEYTFYLNGKIVELVELDSGEDELC